MGRPFLVLNFENASLAEVEVALRCVKTQREANRFLAIRALANGIPREMVAAVFQISERTLCHWISDFNARGIDGLVDAPRCGRTRILSAEVFLEKVLPLLQDPTQADEVHWTGVKLHGYLRKELGLELGYSTLLRQLHQENWTLRIPRPWPAPPKDDVWEEKRAAFLPQFRALLENSQARVFFCDECGGDPRPRRQWAPKGSHPTLGYTGSHVRLNVIGAVEPRTGAMSALVMNACNTEVFQLFLDTLALEQPSEAGYTHHLILDNASWHKAKSLRWHHFQPVYLPPYCLLMFGDNLGRRSPLRSGCPDLNAIERLWLHLKSQWFAGFIAKTHETLMDRILQALQSILQNSQILQSQCRVSADYF